MPARSGDPTAAAGVIFRVKMLGIVLPAPPIPLEAFVVSSKVGNLILIRGMPPQLPRLASDTVTTAEIIKSISSP
jgi:hypothetical protein